MTPSRSVLWIGNRNYSSWSLRAWLALRFMGLEFDVERLPLDTPEFERRIRALPVAGRVPVLQIEGLWLWDSLAICEFVAESASRGGWPQDPDCGPMHVPPWRRCARVSRHCARPCP
ncbi:MAG: glutathione S-transferase N-terminal domain-containing protein [Gammaproteobacteria bacterium]|nr:glutathione S-transferase N-terminal domain-containing protein [Gammaproteobacteria bacterium]